MTGVAPSSRASSATAYRRSPASVPLSDPRGGLLRLDANEGPFSLIAKLGLDIPRDQQASAVREYPDASTLCALVADGLGVEADRVLVTAGGDDALMRACLATIEAGTNAVATTPTFEMIPRYVSLSGGEIRQTPWMDGPFPVAEFTRLIDDQTRAVFVVTPNNPTGLAATVDDLRAVANAARRALVVVDLAYTEFADADLTPVALSLPNAIAVRTFSKAWGLAGIRVGYAAGDPAIIDWLRAVGQPYAVAGPSAAIAAWAVSNLKEAVRAGVVRVREERSRLTAMLRARGLSVTDSSANFVLARTPRAGRLGAVLAEKGVLVRDFPGRAGLEDCLRITCPGEPEKFHRLVVALENAL